MIFNKFKKFKVTKVTIIFMFNFYNLHLNAQVLSPNGYSGLGVVPSAHTIKNGTVTLAHDPTVPGVVIHSGYNTQVGFGLTDNLELVGRLATNDQKCNMYKSGACPENSYRDFHRQ